MKLRFKGMLTIAVAMAMAAMLSVPALAAESMGQGRAVVTVVNKHNKGVPMTVPQQDLKLKVNGHPATIDHWMPATNQLQVVLLIDSSAWGSLGTQLNDMRSFIRSLPANAEAAVAYMQNGQAVFAGPLTKDKESAAREVRLPSSVPGGSASPYFCLSDLAKHWPSQNRNARREVIMITNGVDNYHPRFDPDDPYVQAAITDSVKAGLVVYSIYWHSAGVPPAMYLTSTGQNLLLLVSQATGGEAFWQGFSNPVSFAPYFDQIKQQFGEQYNLGFRAPLRGSAIQSTMSLKTSTPGAKLTAPNQVWLAQPGANEAQ